MYDASFLVAQPTSALSTFGKRKRTFDDLSAGASSPRSCKVMRPPSASRDMEIDVDGADNTQQWHPPFYRPSTPNAFIPSAASQAPLYPKIEPYPHQRPITLRPGSPCAPPSYAAAPAAPPARLLQPASFVHAADAMVVEPSNEVERVRMQHGPGCKSVPLLQVAQSAGLNGERGMYSVCRDCGAIQRVA